MLTVVMDMDKQELRYEINGEELGVAFEGVKGEELWFAMSVSGDGVEVEVLD